MKAKLLLLLVLANFSLYAQTNLVPNGDLEIWQGANPVNWTVVNSVNYSYDAVKGNFSAKLSYLNQSPKITAQVPLKAGVTYTIRFKYKYLTDNYSGSHPISLNISKDGSATTLSSSTFASNNLWTEKVASFTPDADLPYDLSLSVFSFDSASFDVLIDDVKVYVAGTEQYTQIPDVGFENALIARGIDSGTPDGQVLTSNINTLQSLSLETTAISDLTGIQDFTQLGYLSCTGTDYSYTTGGNGKLTSLDLSKNLKLVNLSCNNNQLTSLNIADNVLLASIDIGYNKLTSIDVTKNTQLQRIYSRYNQFTSIDLSKNLKLNGLYIANNKLTTLDLSKNSALNYLDCESNKLLTINLKNGANNALISNSIYIRNNPDLYCIAVDDVDYSKNTWTFRDADAAFYAFSCSSITLLDPAFEDKLIFLDIDKDGKNGAVLNSSISGITNLDVSNSSIAKLKGIEGFTALTTLNCSGNSLKRLDVSKNKFLNNLNCSNNPSLKCIQVENVAATAAWTTVKDAAASFNTDCETYTLIPDSNFEDKLIALRIDRDGKNGKVNNQSIEEITTLDVSSSNISDLTGIEGFTALQKLSCRFNTIENLDITKNTALTNLEAQFNKLSTLDVSQNTLLTDIWVNGNTLTALNTSANKSLTTLYCGSNKITALDVSENVNLTILNCESNKLKAIDVSKNTALKSLLCSYNTITALDVTQNTSLTDLSCGSNDIATIDLSKNALLNKLDILGNELTSLDLKANTNLTFLDCNSNKLTTLDINSNPALEYLSCGNSGNSTPFSGLDVTKNTKLIELQIFQFNIEQIDLSKNTALKMLRLQSGKLSSIDLSNNTALEVIMVNGNNLTTLDLSKNLSLQFLSCAGNQIKTLDLSKNTALTFAECYSNNLTSLNLNNGNNANFVESIGIYFKDFTSRSGMTYYPSFKNNVNLSCIQVDNVTYANTKWSTLKDAEANFSALNCAISTIILDSAFEAKLIALGIDTDGPNGAVLNSSINTLTTLDLSGSSITNFTGIQGFTALETLNISNNLATKIDLSKNSKIKTLTATNNSALTCIMVADVAATANWNVAKDPIASFNLDCEIYTLIPDSNFEDFLIEQKIDRDGKNGKVKTESISQIKYMNDLTSKKIEDLTGIEDFTSLIQLAASYNNLTKVDLSKNTALTYINLSSNKLTSLDVSKNTALTNLNLGSNFISNIDLTNNASLRSLSITNNKLNELDLSKNAQLSSINVTTNYLTALDVTNSPELTEASFSNNQIRTLDFSKNPKLTYVSAANNKLLNVNLKNGANSLLSTNVYFTDNLDLKCIQVDDVEYAKTNWTRIDATASFSTATCPVIVAYTLIPDLNFEKKLINLGIDKDGENGQVETMSIVNVKSLNVANSQIADLSGIQDFTSLQSLDCSNNKLTAADFSKNNLLGTLNISKNLLTSLDATKAASLTSLNCSNNALTTLKITNYVYGNDSKLVTLNCSNNAIKDLYLVNSLQLANLNVSHNELTALDLLKNTQLTTLSASFNNIKYLDVSKNTKLKELDCASNNMYSLNLKNGNNANMQNMIFGNFTENPNLLCIQVDDAAFSTDKWIAKDATASYSTEACPENLQYTLIPDLNFERVLIARNIDKDGENGKVLTASIANIKELYALDLTNKITDLTGIQDFTSLESLYCYHGAITTIDVSKNLKLKYLDMGDNKVTALDVSKNTALEYLDCNSNSLTELNISSNTLLKYVGAANNAITTIDVSKNTDLERLSLYTNKLSNIDIAANKKLESLSISANQLSSIDISNNLELNTISISDNTAINSIDVTKHSKLAYFYAKNCQLTAIDVSKNPLLRNLEISGNKIETIDVTKNPALTNLLLESNQLTSVDIRNGKNNLLVSSYLSFKSNPKLYCILVDDVAYANQNWPYRKDYIATYNTECTGEIIVPANNFTVETKSESCLGENNGEISISARETFEYSASINGTVTAFTNNELKVTSLAPGNYAITITIPGQIFEQNYNVTIAKGATITGKSTLTSKTVNVEITEGTAPFTVFVDGAEQFQTTDSNFSLDLTTSALVEVTTAKACEGVYAKKVAVSGTSNALIAYPNPTTGSIEIEIPETKSEVVIEVFNFGGQLVSKNTYAVENGKVKLNLENLSSGIYAAKVYLKTPEYLKIIKK